MTFSIILFIILTVSTKSYAKNYTIHYDGHRYGYVERYRGSYITSKKYLGNYKITYYCCCKKCGTGNGVTASGVKATPWQTIAVDPRDIPLSSKVLIGNRVYTAHDTGGAIKGKKIDICVSSHAQALRLGRQKANVYLVKEVKIKERWYFVREKNGSYRYTVRKFYTY